MDIFVYTFYVMPNCRGTPILKFHILMYQGGHTSKKHIHFYGPCDFLKIKNFGVCATPARAANFADFLEFNF